MIKKPSIIALFLIVISISVKANTLEFNEKINYLNQLREKLADASVMDRYVINNEFKDALRSLLKNPETLDFSFDGIPSISVISGPKNKFRVYTWMILEDKDNFSFYGFTQYKLNKIVDEVKVTELIMNDVVDDLSFRTLDSSEWMGAIYFDLIEPPRRRDDNYLLLGWNGNGTMTKSKIIEVISFNKEGIPTFGASVFNCKETKAPRGKENYRIVFEYSHKVSMNLRYDDRLNMIVYDHLSPTNPRLKGVRAAYVPDFSYDGFLYDKGEWVEQTDVDARNDKTPKPKRLNPKDYHESR